MIPPLLAFGFETPALLWGLALGALPVIIHLLNRRKFRETQWAAMKFLLEAVRKNSRRLRLEQLILLIVRTMILVLIVLALAQPLVEELGAFFQTSRPTHRIIVIDASLSMGAQSREGTLFDRAQEVAREIAQHARQGDVFNLVRLSNIPPVVIVPTPTYQTSKLVEEIDQLTLPQGRADPAAGLEKVAELLKAAPDVPQKEITLISDFQRTTWLGDSSDEASRVRGLLKKFDESGRLVLVDLGVAGAENVAVTALDALDPFVTVGRPARFKAGVRNFGPQRVTGRVVELLVDDKLVEQRAVEINAGGETTESFAHTFAFGGEHRVQVRLQSDTLPTDDQRWLAIPVKERIKVLCVNGATAPRAMGKATDFLELALSPTTSGPGGGIPFKGRIEPTVVNEGELPGLDLSQYDCVFFCNVRLFTDREARLIEAYLKGGGGVVWTLGDRVQAESYNQALYAQGEGILPARLGDRRGNAETREEVFAFDPGEFTHPIVNPFQGNPDAGLESTLIYVYHQATPAPKGLGRTALKFDTGDPAIIEMAVGRGKSLLVTTSFDDRWGTWPLWPSFLPMVHELVQYAVSGRWGDRRRLVGESLSEVFPLGAVDVDVAVARPDGQTQSVRLIRQDDFNQFVYDGTGTSGIYEVNFAHPIARTELFAVNIDPRESDLSKFVQEELAQELLAGVDFVYETSWEDQTVSAADSPAAAQGGLSRWFVYIVLYLMFTEQLLAWDFRKGLWLLCPIVPFVIWFMGRNSPARPTAVP